MPRAVVVLPSTTYRAGDFVQAAESLGIDLVVASERPPPFDMGDRYLQIDCSDPAAAAASVTSLGDEVALDGVVAADDAGVVVAALAGTTLGLRANDPTSAEATRDKSKMRRLLAADEVPQPDFAVIAAGADPLVPARELGYPVVIKPTDKSASQGVLRVDSEVGLEAAVDRVRAIVGDPHASLLIEEYLEGFEIAVEGLLAEGELMVLAIFDKPDTSAGPAFPETIFVTPSRLPEAHIDEALRVTQAALRALGLEHGPVHVELKVREGTARIIEVAARSIGGLCSRSLHFGLMGTTLETLILRNAIGLDKPELKKFPQPSGVLMIPIPRAGEISAVDGIDEARAIPFIRSVDVTAQVGDLVHPAPEGDRYLGFVFSRATTPEQVEDALRKAQDAITVRIK